jgi:hypothetical protein
MKKRRYWISLSLNVIIFLTTLFATFVTIIGSFGLPGFEWCSSDVYAGNVGGFFASFSNDAGILLCFASLGMVVADIKVLFRGRKMTRWPIIFKLVATVASFFSFLLVYCVVLTKNGFTVGLLFDWRNSLWFSTIGPALAVISFLTVEFDPDIRYGWSLLSLIPVTSYLFILVHLLDQGTLLEPPYFFLDTNAFERGSVVGWCVGFILFTQLLATFLFLIRKGLRRILFGQKTAISEIQAEPKDEDGEKFVKILRLVEDGKKTDENKASPSKTHVYQVLRSQSGKWQVKLAGHTKIIKLFSTQEEAISFAKELASSKDGSVQIHSLSGKIRKE